MANMNFGVNILPKANNTYTLGNSDYKWNIFANTLNGQTILSDVQVNSTSIVNNGIASIPIATANDASGYRLVQVNFSNGIYVASDNCLSIVRANESDAKSGSNAYKVCTPYWQHYYTFYGLAKAAGDSTQAASSNAVGTYTDGAKTAIQNMLAVAPTANPVFTGSISLERDANSTIGYNSVSLGHGNAATGNCSIAMGLYNYANADASVAIGYNNMAMGTMSFAGGYGNSAHGAFSYSFGLNTVNDIPPYTNWTASTSYAVGDNVVNSENNLIYTCIEANSDATFNYGKWIPIVKSTFIEKIGNGELNISTGDFGTPSNARALDWEGNEYLNGYIYVGCDNDSTNGTRIPHDIQINGTSIASNGIANIPIATWNTLGVVKAGADYGVGMLTGGNLGIISVQKADTSLIKAGTNIYKPIVPYNQHESVFYGLAKAAGDSTQSASSNAVGIYTDDAKTAIQSMLGINTMTGATASVAGTSGLVPAPATTDVDKFLAGDGTYKSGGLPMVILSYGNSTWQDFINAYNNNVIVYTRASSNSNPASGSQTRMAFMAYVNNATTPTEVEFQYYRSMSSHSATAMGDQVFVYKLTKTGGWSVTTRDASIKQIKMATGSAGSVSWSSNVVTLNSGLPAVTADDNGKILKVVNGAWAVVDP